MEVAKAVLTAENDQLKKEIMFFKNEHNAELLDFKNSYLALAEKMQTLQSE